MISKEFDEILADIKIDKQQRGLIYEDFEPLMLKHGFASSLQIPLLQKAFSLISNFNQHKRVSVLSISDFKILIYCIRNFYDYKLMQYKQVTLNKKVI
jgi:CRISPR/Cas system CMR-associated protein Cmr1 (group 7 of RAMP superfamily)